MEYARVISDSDHRQRLFLHSVEYGVSSFPFSIIYKNISKCHFSLKKKKKTLWSLLKNSFPGGSAGKESTCSTGDLGLIPGLGRSPEGRLGNPLQYSCLESPHGQRSLAGYSPWGHKALDMTEHSTHSNK